MSVATKTPVQTPHLAQASALGRIPLHDLRTQYHAIRDEARAVFEAVADSGEYVDGAATFSFEAQFAAWCGAKECVGLNSGASALHLALRCLDITHGDEVITVPMAYFATVEAIRHVGAQPVFVDIDPVRRTMDPSQLERAITPRTKAIVPVHLHGQVADMDLILELADTYGIPVVEDASQAHGASYQGRKAGTLGELACFSFGPDSHFSAVGEAGALVTSNPRYAERARQLRNHAQAEPGFHDEIGQNYRMETLQAALLALKLKHLDRWNLARAFRAVRYKELLQDLPLTLPAHFQEAQSVHHSYVIESDLRDDLRTALDQAGIDAGLQHSVPLHLQRACRNLGYAKGRFPHSENFARRCLSLPMFAELSDEQMIRVATVLHSALQEA